MAEKEHFHTLIVFSKLEILIKKEEIGVGKITGQEYLQYITEQFVDYIETPASTRKNAKKAAKALKEPWLLRWFGAGGASILLWLKRKK